MNNNGQRRWFRGKNLTRCFSTKTPPSATLFTYIFTDRRVVFFGLEHAGHDLDSLVKLGVAFFDLESAGHNLDSLAKLGVAFFDLESAGHNLDSLAKLGSHSLTWRVLPVI